MHKKKYRHLLSFRIEIPINSFQELQKVVELYNFENQSNLDNRFIHLFYDNKHLVFKNKSFVGRGRRISLNKAKSLLLDKKAILYLGNEAMMVKQKCVVKSGMISLFADDMSYATFNSFKDINTLNNEISTIIAFIEYFDGDLVYTGELRGSDNILICYKTGYELHNIENKCPLCESIYMEYKIDTIYCTEGFNITFTSLVENNERTLLADNVFLESIFQSINQYGGDIIVYENTEMHKISFIIHNIKLSELIYHKLEPDSIKLYRENTEKYQSLLSEYKSEIYKKYFNINFEAFKDNNFENYFNIQNIYQRLDKRDFLVNVKQVDESIVCTLYSPKYAYIPKEEHLKDLDYSTT